MNKKDQTTFARADLAPTLRLIACAVLLCIAMSAMLAIYNSLIPKTLLGFEEKGNMENTAWLVKYASYLPPVIVLALIVSAIYFKKEDYIPVTTQKHKAIAVGVAFVFTYAVLFSYALLTSPGWNAPIVEGEERIATLFENTVGWFFAQIVPFCILLSYHLVRASSEKKELYGNE